MDKGIRLNKSITVTELNISDHRSRSMLLCANTDNHLCRSMMSDDNSCQTTTDLQMVQPSQNHFPSF